MSIQLSQKIIVDDLFREKISKKRKEFRKEPVDFDFFKTFLISLNSINKNANDEFFSKKYEDYLHSFYTLSEKYKVEKINCNYLKFLNFYPQSTSLQFYLDRGYNLEESKEKLRERQRVEPTESYIKNHRESWFKNKETNLLKIKYSFPSTKGYWKKKYPEMSEEEISKKIFEFQSKNAKIAHERERASGKRRLYNTSLDYYISKGLSEEEAKNALKERQDKSSLKSYINHYGLEEGIKKYNSRIEKFKKTWNSKSNIELEEIAKKRARHIFYSNASKLFFDELKKRLFDENINLKMYYAENEHFIWDSENKRLCFYDCYLPEINFVIEYNGIVWHPNRKILNEKEWSEWRMPGTNISADEKERLDNLKLKLLSNNNIQYYIVWENECMENELEKLKEIIKTKYNA